jgi:hypothetical protein
VNHRSNRIHGRARTDAIREVREAHRSFYDVLITGYRQEAWIEFPDESWVWINNRARRAAERDLVEMYEEEYSDAMERHLTRRKAEAGSPGRGYRWEPALVEVGSHDGAS